MIEVIPPFGANLEHTRVTSITVYSVAFFVMIIASQLQIFAQVWSQQQVKWFIRGHHSTARCLTQRRCVSTAFRSSYVASSKVLGQTDAVSTGYILKYL